MLSKTLLNRRRDVTGLGVSCALLMLVGCARHLEFPPMGEPLPSSAKLQASPTITDLSLRYSNSCGQPQEIPLGDRLHEALREGIQRTFKTVIDDSHDGTTVADHVIHVDLVDSSFDLNKEALYDRAPARLHLNAITRVYDQKGELLRQADIKTARHERLHLEHTSKNCDYIIDPFINDIVIDFATRVSLNARLAAGGQEPAASMEPNQTSAGGVGGASPALQFKATLLDENSNLTFEGGEHIRVRVDIVNTGTEVIENASASLTGTPSVIERFPAPTLKIPPLQPGQTRSVEFLATLPVTVQPMEAEIRVGVTETGGPTAPSQTLPFTVELPSDQRH